MEKWSSKSLAPWRRPRRGHRQRGRLRRVGSRGHRDRGATRGARTGADPRVAAARGPRLRDRPAARPAHRQPRNLARTVTVELPARTSHRRRLVRPTTSHSVFPQAEGVGALGVLTTLHAWSGPTVKSISTWFDWFTPSCMNWPRE